MNYLFKSCIMLGFVALGLNSTVAQAITDVKQECLSNKKLTSYQFNLKNKNLKIARDTGSTKVYAPVKTASDFMYEADGKSVNVTLIPNYGNEELDYEQINAMDSKGEVFYITDESFGVYTAELPVGTYDFLYYFSTPQEDYYVIKEQVEINSDVTLDLDIAEADKKYVLNTFLPDGEKCTLKRIKYNKDTNQYDVIEKGSINDIFTDMFLSLNGSII